MSETQETQSNSNKRSFDTASTDRQHQNRQRKRNKPNNQHWKSRNEQDAERKRNSKALDGDDAEDDGGPRDKWNQRGGPHPGSYPLEEILQSTDYQSRHISQPNPVKKKFVLCISYLGTNYQGLQINPGAHTVEQELEKGLLYNGSLIPENFGYFSKIQYSRAARTDRGVHALTQSCAMRLIVPREVDNNEGDARDLFLSKLNTLLPSDIQVLGIIKVSKNFNAHAKCTKRIYHYLLPTYVLQSKEKILSLLNALYERQGPIKGAGYEGGYVDPNTSKSLSTESLSSVYSTLAQDYRISSDVLESFRQALKQYEGTRSYHNYTTGKDATEANAKRYILSCTCEDPFVNPVTNVEFVKIVFYGQSFLLNQIRKMVGMAIEVVHGSIASLEQMQSSFQADCKMEIPMIPALGLYLADIFFDGYNNRQRILSEKDQQSKEKAQANTDTDKISPEEQGTVENEKKEEAEAEIEEEEGEEKEKGGNAGNGGDQSEMEREEVYWYDNPSIKARLVQFQENVLYPHIFQQEKDSLAFLYYLDFLRAFPHRYPITISAPSK